MRLIFQCLFLLFITSQVQASPTIIPETPLLCSQFVEGSEKSWNCLRDSFNNALSQADYKKVSDWLEQKHMKRILTEAEASYLLGILVCEAKSSAEFKKLNKSGLELEGGITLQPENRQLFIKIIEQLLSLGASFESMPSQRLVTNLFCVVNNRDSEMLDYVLTRMNAESKDLNGCFYEGADPSYVPLFKAIENDDLESARVLNQHGASLDYRELDTTPLIHALKLKKFSMVEWLLDMGASVYETDDGKCTGKLPIAYAREVPATFYEREVLIVRIESSMQISPNPCKKKG